MCTYSAHRHFRRLQIKALLTRFFTVSVASFSTAAAMGPRFNLYVKATKDGSSVGDCPFSQYVNMVTHLKVPRDHFTLIPVDFSNKTQEFLSLNPKGTVPVLVDTETMLVIADSQDIVRYLHEKFPDPDIRLGYDGPATEACSGIFPKLAALLKNKDKEAIPALRKALEDELVKMDSFLKSKQDSGKYLTGDCLSALDCSILPKLQHVQVAGRYYQKFDIPDHLDALHKYIKVGETCQAFQDTNYPEDEIIFGWSRHGIMKVD